MNFKARKIGTFPISHFQMTLPSAIGRSPLLSHSNYPNQLVRISQLSVNNPIGAIRVCQHVFSHSAKGKCMDFPSPWKIENNNASSMRKPRKIFWKFSLCHSVYNAVSWHTEVKFLPFKWPRMCMSKEENLFVQSPKSKSENWIKAPISMRIKRTSSSSHSQNCSKYFPFDWTQFGILEFLTAEVFN